MTHVGWFDIVGGASGAIVLVYLGLRHRRDVRAGRRDAVWFGKHR